MLRALIATMLLLALLPTAASAQTNSTPASAVQLLGEQSGDLSGGMGGHFRYYRVAYPGGWPLVFDLKPHTVDKAVLRYLGYNVYGPEPNRIYVEGKLDENGVFVGAKELFSPDRGVYLVQVYSYYPDPTSSVGYTLVAGNIPPQPGAGEPEPRPIRGAAGFSAVPLEGVQRGSLPPNTGGSFRYYSFVAQANTTVAINAHITPGDASILTRAGFKVYGPERDKEYLEAEDTPGRHPNQRGTLWITQTGTYVIQMHNYDPQVAIEYELWWR